MLVLRGPNGQELKLKLGDDYNALATGGSGKVKAGVVFVGYGITAPDLKYDEYGGTDVEGKVVLLIRREPQQNDEKSKFNGKAVSTHSYIRTKIQAAKKAKAAAILMVNDVAEVKDGDKITAVGGFGLRALGLPVG